MKKGKNTKPAQASHDHWPHHESAPEDHLGAPLTGAAFEDHLHGRLHAENQRPLSNAERELIERHRALLKNDGD